MTAIVVAAGIAGVAVVLGVAGLLVYKPALERRADAHEKENRTLWALVLQLYEDTWASDESGFARQCRTRIEAVISAEDRRRQGSG